MFEVDARQIGGTVPPFRFFKRMEAVVLTMLECWDEVDDALRPLDGVAECSRYLRALVRAIRKEISAARGGPAPTHAALRELGYHEWSQLLAYRPGSSSP
jgi:hypothetical protein